MVIENVLYESNTNTMLSHYSRSNWLVTEFNKYLLDSNCLLKARTAFKSPSLQSAIKSLVKCNFLMVSKLN